jgi:hypothetical protein
VGLDTLRYSVREWTRVEFYLEDYVPLTNEMRVRFVAQDNGVGGSIVEAGIDDFSIVACQEAIEDLEDPVVTVIAPNGGEHCDYGSSYDIQWTATDNVGVVSVTILLSTDSGLTFPDTVATGEANDGSYTWSVPDIDSKTACVKVVATDPSLNEGEDVSDGDFVLWGTASGIGPGDPAGVPGELSLEVTGSNPVGASARIVFGLPAAAKVSLGIYDVTGRNVDTLAGGRRSEGYHTVDWSPVGRSGAQVSPGIYFVRLESEKGRKTAKIVIAK